MQKPEKIKQIEDICLKILHKKIEINEVVFKNKEGLVEISFTILEELK